MKKFKKLLAIALSLITLIAISGCAMEKNGQNGDEATDQESDKVVFTFSTSDTLSFLDKYYSKGAENMDISWLWGDTLIMLDENENYVANLAESWSWSEDGLHLTVKLRQGVKFSNGDELCSQDVKCTYERFIKDGNLTNASVWKDIESVDCPDEYTAVINFSSIMTTFLSENLGVVILNHSVYEENPEEYFSNPIGTGEFKIISYDPAEGTISLEKRDDWWGAEYFGESSNVDIINYKCISEDTTRISSLRAGELDFIQSCPSDNVELLKSEGFNVISFIQTNHIFLGLNCSEGAVFESKELREALSLCINRELLCNSVLGGGQPCDWPVNSSSVGYKYGSYEYNLEKAKELIKESGYDGREINLIFANANITRAMEVVRAIQSMACDAGLNIKLKSYESATFEEMRTAGNYDIALGAHGVPMGECVKLLTEIVLGDTFKTGYVNEELNALIETTKNMADYEERYARSQECMQIMMDEFAPNIYLYFQQSNQVSAPNISSIRSYSNSHVDLRFVRKD